MRPVAHADARLKEAAKLGFAEAWVPVRPSRSAKPVAGDGLATVAIEHLSELVARLSPVRRPGVAAAGARRVMVSS